MERVRHTITLEKNVALFELQRQNWQCFVEKMLSITDDPNFKIDDEEMVHNVLENVKLCQKFYINIYDFCENSLKE